MVGAGCSASCAACACFNIDMMRVLFILLLFIIVRLRHFLLPHNIDPQL